MSDPRFMLNVLQDSHGAVARSPVSNEATEASVPESAIAPDDSSAPQAARRTIQVYDRPLCCSTGVCGPEVDPVLPRFAADLQWLKSQGHAVERYNLAQQPQAFVGQPEVQRQLMADGTSCLPMIVVDGRIVSRQVYPTRDQLVGWTLGERTEGTEGRKSS